MAFSCRSGGSRHRHPLPFDATPAIRLDTQNGMSNSGIIGSDRRPLPGSRTDSEREPMMAPLPSAWPDRWRLFAWMPFCVIEQISQLIKPGESLAGS